MPRCHEEYNEASVSFRQMHSDSRYASRHLHRFVFRPSFSQRPTDFPRWVCTRPRFLVTYVEKLVNHLPPLPSSFLLFFFFFLHLFLQFSSSVASARLFLCDCLTSSIQFWRAKVGHAEMSLVTPLMDEEPNEVSLVIISISVRYVYRKEARKT